MFRGCGKEGRARQATEQRSVELMSLLARGTSTVRDEGGRGVPDLVASEFRSHRDCYSTTSAMTPTASSVRLHKADGRAQPEESRARPAESTAFSQVWRKNLGDECGA